MRQRRGRGEGALFQRKDGQWVGTVTVGYDGSGKRRRQAVYASTKAVVLEKLRAVQAAAAAGTLGSGERLAVAAFLDRWLKDDVKSSISPEAHWRYAGVVRTKIVPQLGGLA